MGNDMTKFVIKPMETAQEMDGKGYVHYKSWRETYAGIIDADYLETMTEEKCRALAYKRSYNTLVAKDGDRVIGFVGYNKYRDDSLGHCGEIHSIYVLAGYRGQKVGYGLMNAAMEQLAEYPKVALWVLEGNEGAIRFYEQYGFRFDGQSAQILVGTPRTELRMIFQRKTGK